jgi:3-methylcrotonyl-CoA carboxylase alpha subunit
MLDKIMLDKIMFSKILIANRGEIACRIISTAKRLGIQTVAVYSDADANARHVKMADQAFRLGPAPARESYLRGDLIIQIAQDCGAQAIHPGYGFLSENESFANACQAKSIVFIGPPASAIAAMGSKSAAKTLMQKAQVPLVPGYHGEDQSETLLASEAAKIGYPVLIKASAGGGGKGMRIVKDAADFAAALASCKRESLSSFSDDRVLIERYLAKPRHIEVQVFADQHGDCVYLFERDCSVQRRHQKVIEEAPAPGISEQLRAQMGEAAVKAAKAVNYIGAGTVEFIAEAGSAPGATPTQFFFMEMNTRLQVEHPVTEMITGLDLVEWQLRVAAGERLPMQQSQLRIHGHAIEARIYSENADKDFLPATGSITHLKTPQAVEFKTGQTPTQDARTMSGNPASVRIDSGIEQGAQISPFYDPMISKLIVWGADRAAAIAQMSQALKQFEVGHLVTNVRFLQSLMTSQSFTCADLDTSLIERERPHLFGVKQHPHALYLACAALLANEKRNAEINAAHTNYPNDPWSRINGWRINDDLERTLIWHDANTNVHTVVVRYAKHGFELSINDANDKTKANWVCISQPTLNDHDQLNVVLGNETLCVSAVVSGSQYTVFNQGVAATFTHHDLLRTNKASDEGGGRLTAPMPGKIVAIQVKAGDIVKKGAALVVMEAMKMEHTLSAPSDATIDEILFKVGDQVTEGTQLVSLKVSA